MLSDSTSSLQDLISQIGVYVSTRSELIRNLRKMQIRLKKKTLALNDANERLQHIAALESNSLGQLCDLTREQLLTALVVKEGLLDEATRELQRAHTALRAITREPCRNGSMSCTIEPRLSIDAADPMERWCEACTARWGLHEVISLADAVKSQQARANK